jgi:hypothetical protein
MDDDKRKCSICGAPAVGVDNVDTKKPEWRCAEHMPPQIQETALALLVADERFKCIVCGASGDIGQGQPGALNFYGEDHAPAVCVAEAAVEGVGGCPPIEADDRVQPLFLTEEKSICECG